MGLLSWLRSQTLAFDAVSFEQHVAAVCYGGMVVQSLTHPDLTQTIGSIIIMANLSHFYSYSL